MAAIAKFISYDGGIAFSERVMKVQEADQEAVIISLDDVAAVRIRRPQDDAEGFIRVDTADGKHYRIYFEDDQLQEAVQFKRQFDATVSDGEEDRTLAPVPAPRQSKQSYVKSTQPYSGNPRRQARKPILKKWWFWAAAAVLIIGVIVAIVGGGSDKEENAPSAGNANVSEPATQNVVQSTQEQVSGAVNVGDYAVEIKSAFKTTDYEGNPALAVVYTWTNNSSETTSAMASLLEKAFQDGIELEHAILVDVEGYDNEAEWKEIRPGASLDVYMAFSLRSDSSVEVEVSNWLSSSDPATKTFDLNNL